MSSAFDTGPRPRAASSGQERDPDLGPTKKTPSTQEQLDRSELVIRAEKIKHLRTQTKLVDEANAMTRHPKKTEGA